MPSRSGKPAPRSSRRVHAQPPEQIPRARQRGPAEGRRACGTGNMRELVGAWLRGGGRAHCGRGRVGRGTPSSSHTRPLDPEARRASFSHARAARASCPSSRFLKAEKRAARRSTRAFDFALRASAGVTAARSRIGRAGLAVRGPRGPGARDAARPSRAPRGLLRAELLGGRAVRVRAGR